ncbi:MAG: four helix bundle protein [Candidatus Berkelbacteria bacterium]
MDKIRSFTDLKVWQEGHKLVLAIYKTTKNYPREEIFALTSQTKRCVVSITSNVAEGFSRRTSKDKLSFFVIALGSLTELQNQLLIARDLKYIDAPHFCLLADQTILVQKILSGLIKSAKDKI